MMEDEVVFCQFGYPASLSSVQLLRLLEILEVLVICPDFNIYGGAHQVVAPFIAAWAARFLLEMCQLTVVINVSGLSVDTSAYIGYFHSTAWSISQHRKPDQIM